MLIGIDKNRFFNITTNNTDKLDCTFSTNKQKTDFHNQLFEANWLLSNARFYDSKVQHSFLLVL